MLSPVVVLGWGLVIFFKWWGEGGGRTIVAPRYLWWGLVINKQGRGYVRMLLWHVITCGGVGVGISNFFKWWGEGGDVPLSHLVTCGGD